MQHSENLDELAPALAKACQALRDVEHDAKNPHLRNRYATLSAVLTHARPILAAEGLSLTQWLGGVIAEGQPVTVCTQITHQSGQWLRSEVGAIVERGRGVSIAQSGGSQISYLRRYAALAALGISSADDVDGHVEAPQPKPRPAAKRWSDAERSRFCAILSGWGLDYDAVARWCESKGKPRPSGMPQTQRNKLLAWLEGMDGDSRLTAMGVEP